MEKPDIHPVIQLDKPRNTAHVVLMFLHRQLRFVFFVELHQL
jgi:hypothetical protein